MHHHTWKACATSSFESVARTKEHLYRKHKAPIQCVRCWIFFKTQDDLNIHISAINICDVRPGQPIEGINHDMILRLRSRKKTSNDQNEEDRWKRMYGTIFPNEEMPSPFFEPVSDDIAQFQEPIGLPIEEFMRQQLPQFLSSRLEMEIIGMDFENDNSASDNRTRLREIFVTRIPRLVNGAVDDAASAYRQRLIGDTSLRNIMHTPPPSYRIESSQTPLPAISLSTSHTASLPGSDSQPTPRQANPPNLTHYYQIQDSPSDLNTTQHSGAHLTPELNKENICSQYHPNPVMHPAEPGAPADILPEIGYNTDEEQQPQAFDWPLSIDWEAEYNGICSNGQV